MKWRFLIAISAAGCGKIGYDATLLDEPDFRDAGADAEMRDAVSETVESSMIESSVDSGDSGAVEAGRNCGTVAMTAPIVTRRYGGSAPGPEMNDLCPSGQAIIGFTGRVAVSSLVTLGTIQALCGQIVLERATCAVRVLPTSTLPERGEVGTEPYDQICPPDRIVAGVRGRAGTRVDQLSLECAELTLSATNFGRLVAGRSIWLPPSGGDGGNPFESACPDGRLVNGYGVRIDKLAKLVETIWLHCGLPEFAP